MSNNYSVNEVSTGIGGFLIFLALIGFMVAVSYAGLSENWQALAALMALAIAIILIRIGLIVWVLLIAFVCLITCALVGAFN